MATDTTSTPPRPGRDSGPSARRRRRRPRWWLILLGAAAVIVIAIIVAIQLQPNAADGPPAVGATQVALRDTRFHPPVIQVTQGQTVTWSFDDQGTTTHNVKGKGWGSGDQASGTFRHTFTAPGNYRYSCTLHLGMNGRVDVVARAAQHHENGRHGATERRRAGRGDDDHGLAGAASSASSAVLEGREIASW